MLPVTATSNIIAEQAGYPYAFTEWHGGFISNSIPAYHGNVQSVTTVQIARCEYCRTRQEMSEVLSCIACGAPLP